MTDDQDDLHARGDVLSQSVGMEPREPEPASEWRQAHWAFILTRLLRNLRGFVIPFAVFLFSRGGNDRLADFFFFGAAGFVALAAFGASTVQWWFYRYRLTARDITLRSGVISKQERIVPYERIQSVDLDEAPLERLLRVVRVRIETAAGGQVGSDIQIQALRRDEAAALRTQLLTARQALRAARHADSNDPLVAPSLRATAAGAPVATPAAAPADRSGAMGGELIRRMSTRDLLLTGATSGRIGPAAALVGAISQFGDDLIPDNLWNRVPWDGFVAAASDLRIITGAILVFGVIAWLLAIVTTILTFGGFELRREDDQLYLQFGLLDRRRVTIPMRRIQAISVHESMLRQPFGLAEVRFETAGFGKDTASNGVLFPMLRRSEVAALLMEATPEFAMDIDPSHLNRLPSRARSRYVVSASIGWVITVALASAIVNQLTDIPWWWVTSLVLATPGFVWFGALRYRDAGWLLDGEQFLMRWRAVGRVTILTRIRRVQFRKLTADPFQRRASLATFHAAVASGSLGGGIELPHLDAEEATALAFHLGGQASSRSRGMVRRAASDR
jgi:putative membrane protein